MQPNNSCLSSTSTTVPFAYSTPATLASLSVHEQAILVPVQGLHIGYSSLLNGLSLIFEWFTPSPLPSSCFSVIFLTILLKISPSPYPFSCFISFQARNISLQRISSTQLRGLLSGSIHQNVRGMRQKFCLSFLFMALSLPLRRMPAHSRYLINAVDVMNE